MYMHNVYVYVYLCLINIKECISLIKWLLLCETEMYYNSQSGDKFNLFYLFRGYNTML